MDSLVRLVRVPALITLGVTLLRLIGELQRWSPKLFNREAGGGGALVGISLAVDGREAWYLPVGHYLAEEQLSVPEVRRSMGQEDTEAPAKADNRADPPAALQAAHKPVPRISR